jgi:hypothetical protein
LRTASSVGWGRSGRWSWLAAARGPAEVEWSVGMLQRGKCGAGYLYASLGSSDSFFCSQVPHKLQPCKLQVSVQMSCLSRQAGLRAPAAAQRPRYNALHHMMGKSLQQGWPWHCPCRASRRWPTVWLLLIGASVSPWRQSAAAGVIAVTLPAADGSSPDWSYTLPAAPQRCAGSDWLCTTGDSVVAVPGSLYAAAAPNGACAQLSTALGIWQCGGALLAEETYTAVRSGGCSRTCAQASAKLCTTAPAPAPVAALPLAAAPAPGDPLTSRVLRPARVFLCSVSLRIKAYFYLTFLILPLWCGSRRSTSKPAAACQPAAAAVTAVVPPAADAANPDPAAAATQPPSAAAASLQPPAAGRAAAAATAPAAAAPAAAAAAAGSRRSARRTGRCAYKAGHAEPAGPRASPVTAVGRGAQPGLDPASARASARSAPGTRRGPEPPSRAALRQPPAAALGVRAGG